MPEYSVRQIIDEINNTIFLPAIQRSFVWKDSFICKLLDSLCSGYPIGSITTWETYDEIEYRKFIDGSYRRVHKGTYNIEKTQSDDSSKNLVLDGQQRLQSLFLALKGQIDGKLLYMNVLYAGNEDKSEPQYDFRFLENDHEALAYSDKQIEDKHVYFIPVRDFLVGLQKSDALVGKIIENASISEQYRTLIMRNIDGFINMLNREDCFHLIEIDKGLNRNDTNRKSISEILEIFVRINQQQTRLSRADLIFSTLKMRRDGIAQSVDHVLEELNQNHSLKIDLNFLIRCMFVTSDLGAGLELKVLSQDQNVENISRNFPACITAIKSVLDFVCTDLQLIHTKQVSGLNTLIPFVYYAFNCAGHKLPNKNKGEIKKACYLLSLSRSLSRWGESRITKMVKDDLSTLDYNADDLVFPYTKVVSWVAYWEDISEVSKYLLGLNPFLVFTLIQGKTVQATQSKDNNLELDHIYPRKILEEKDVEKSVVDSIGNLWLLARTANRNKSAKPPKQYFHDALKDNRLSQSDLAKAKIEKTGNLHGNGHRSFIKDREKLLLKSFLKKTGIKQSDFVSEEE